MDEQQERYVDPNSGAAPQPGGYALGHPVAESDLTEPEAVETDEATTEESPEETTEETGEETGVEETEEAQTGPAVTSEYDPGDYTIEEVVQYVADHPEERASILEKEEAGKNRSTLVPQLQEQES